MTSYVTPKKNTAFKFYVGLIDQSNTKLLKANPTIAAGDFKVSTDGAAFANLATLPSANPAGGRAVMIDLSSGEMNGDNIVVACVDAAGAEWCDLLIPIQTTARQIDDLSAPTVALTEAYAALHAAPTQAQLLFEIRALLAEKTVSGTTLTAKKIDGSTTAETFTLNDGTTPTAITRAS